MLREFLKSTFELSSFFGRVDGGWTGAYLVSNSLGGSGNFYGAGFVGLKSSSSSSSAPAKRLEIFLGGSSWAAGKTGGVTLGSAMGLGTSTGLGNSTGLGTSTGLISAGF